MSCSEKHINYEKACKKVLDSLDKKDKELKALKATLKERNCPLIKTTKIFQRSVRAYKINTTT